MAKLSIDVEVKGVRSATGQLEDLVVVGKEAEEIFERIGAGASFSKLTRNLAAVMHIVDDVAQNYQSLNQDIKFLRSTQGTTSREAIQGLKLQENAVKSLDKAYKENITLLNKRRRATGEKLDNVEAETRELEKQNKVLRRQAKMEKLMIQARIEDIKRTRQKELKLIRDREIAERKAQAAKKKQIRDTLAFQARMQRQREREEAAAARKLYQQRKKYLQRLGAISAGLGFGFAAGGAAGVAVGAINLVTRSVEGLARAWLNTQRAAARSFYEINKNMEQLRILLNTATGSELGGAAAFDQVLAFSETAPFSLDALTDSYVKLRTAGLDPMDGTLRTLTDSVAAFGGGSEQLKLVTIAIQQMVGKGVISMEELRRQFGEQVPTAIRAMARGLGVDILTLFDTIESGSLDATKAINAMLPELNKLHGGASQKRMKSMEGAVIGLGKAWTRLMLQVGDQNSLWQQAINLVNDAADAINEFRESAAGQMAIGNLTRQFNEAITILRENKGVIRDFFNLMGWSLRNSIKLAATLVDKFTTFRKWWTDTGYIEKWFDVFTGGWKKVSQFATGFFSKIMQEMFGLDFQPFFDRVFEKFDWLRDKAKEAVQKIKGTFDYGIHNITEEWSLGLDSIDFSTPLQQLEAIDAKNFKNLEQELTEISQSMIGLKESISDISEEFDKVLTKNYKEERKLAIKFGLVDDGTDIREVIDAISKQIKQVNVEEEAGRKKVLSLLEKQRDLIREMSTDVDKVTKAEVRAARAKYEEYARISRGGRVAGTSDELRKLYAEYVRLSRLQKEGKADEREQKEIAKEKLGLLQQNSQLTREMQAAATATQQTDLEELQAEYTLKEKMKKMGVKDIAELRQLEATAHAQKMQELNAEWEMYKKINAEKAGATTTATGPNSYSPPTARYAGGPVDQNRPYIVGERGPELFVPKQSGNIVPNNELKNSETTKISFNFNNKQVGPFFSKKEAASELIRELEMMQGAMS